jgi:hypothetical protein
MLAIQFTFEILILCVCSLGPGVWLLRRLRCNPLEKLCIAIALSWLLVYLAATIIYLTHLPAQFYFAITAICLLLTIPSFKELHEIWQNGRARSAILCFAALFLWHLLMLAIIRSYAGANLGGDWFEHYQRTIFFLDHLPNHTLFFGNYGLPARPPMMNLLACAILAQCGRSFALFQPAFAFLSLLVYFPCLLITPYLSRRPIRPALLMAFFAASPILVQNVTFTWTKLFAAFYIILGIALYLRGWQKQDPIRIVAAFASLASGFIVHYSAGPYLLFIFLHYSIHSPSRKHKFRELFASALLGGIVLLSWFAWALPTFGFQAGIESNTTVADTAKLSPLQNLQKIAGNILATFIPHPLHVPWHEFQLLCYQPNLLGQIRDYFFLIYQDTLPFSLGSVGSFIVLYLLYKSLKSPQNPKRLRIFWATFTLFCALVGIAVHGAAEPWGVAHVCLQPLSILGITFLTAQSLNLPPLARQLVLFGFILDFCLGIFLHLHLQRLYPTPHSAPDGLLFPLNSQSLSLVALGNFQIHAKYSLAYFSDSFAPFQFPLQIVVIVIFVTLILPALRREPKSFSIGLLLLLFAGSALCMQDQFQPDISPASSPAQIALRQATVNAHPDSSAAWRALGQAFYDNNQPLDANPCFFEGYFLDVDNPQGRFEALFVWRVTGKMRSDDAAPFHAAELVAHFPNSPQARDQLAQFLLQLHHPQAAQLQSERANQLSP